MRDQGSHHAPGEQTSATADFLAGAAQCLDHPHPANRRAHIRNLEAKLWLGPRALHGSQTQCHPALSSLHRLQSAQSHSASVLKRKPSNALASKTANKHLIARKRWLPSPSEPRPKPISLPARQLRKGLLLRGRVG